MSQLTAKPRLSQLGVQDVDIAASTSATTTQAPNDVTNAKWQHPYLEYSVFMFIQWEEVEMRCPSLYSVHGSDIEGGNPNDFDDTPTSPERHHVRCGFW